MMSMYLKSQKALFEYVGAIKVLITDPYACPGPEPEAYILCQCRGKSITCLSSRLY